MRLDLVEVWQKYIFWEAYIATVYENLRLKTIVDVMMFHNQKFFREVPSYEIAQDFPARSTVNAVLHFL